MMKRPLAGWAKAFALAVCVAFAPDSLADERACNDAFPPPTPETLHEWSSDGLANLRDTANYIGSTAIIIVSRGELVFSHGDIARALPVRSIRKSLVSAMVGQAVVEGLVDLDANLSSLTEPNFSKLSEGELKARIRDLMASRSGIYLPAAAETSDASAKRPARGAYSPGKHWYYNNWDFNAVGAIFQARTGASAFDAFQARLAEPLCMQDYVPKAGQYAYLRNFWGVRQSAFPAYHFKLSARDLARFGQLCLRNGVWAGRQIAPNAWVADSTRAISKTTEPLFDGYGLMWWSVAAPPKPDELAKAGLTGGLPEGSYAAAGYGGQWLILIPAWDTVIVHLTDTSGWLGGNVLTTPEKVKLFNAIIAAR